MDKGKAGQSKQHAFSAIFLSGHFSRNDWYVDSGASIHLTVHKGWLKNVKNLK
jgi:hypothetical protein